MAENSKIQWTTHTFNPWIGCEKISPGCANCYAASWDDRMHAGEHWGPKAAREATKGANWRKPVAWDKASKVSGERAKVFCASLADVFDAKAPVDKRADLFELIKATPNLDWLLLTKRPENAPAMLPPDWGDGYSNVWFGVTTEDQIRANERIAALKQIKAAVKFLSVEPQLEKIDFSKWFAEKPVPFDWMIFGGESGDKARPFDPEWIKGTLDQAGAVGVARFVKQMGLVWAKAHGVDDKKKGGTPEEWPDWLRIREFPESKVLN